MEKHGVENIKEIVLFAGRVARLIEAVADGFGVGDIFQAIAVAKLAPAAFKDIERAWDEYRDMDDEEALVIDAAIEEEFDLEDDKIEAFVEQALKIAVELRGLAQLFPKKVA